VGKARASAAGDERAYVCKLNVEAFILAGGLSSRMGRDKSRVRLGGRTLTGHIRATLRGLGLKARLIRKDSVKRCGPIGGILTALETSRMDCVLVLACDMPFVSEALVRKVVAALRTSDKAVFASANRLAGFPLLLRREACLPIVRRQIERGDFSLQSLARVVRARVLDPAERLGRDLFNVNSPDELRAARKLFLQ
jgi:molybdopterin-guanine dinucleotide biosynthesis protein A